MGAAAGRGLVAHRRIARAPVVPLPRACSEKESKTARDTVGGEREREIERGIVGCFEVESLSRYFGIRRVVLVLWSSRN